MAAARSAKVGQSLEIGGVVDPRQLGQVGGIGSHHLEIGPQVQVLDAGHHGRDAGRTFGMSSPFMSELPRRPDDDQHAHDSDTDRPAGVVLGLATNLRSGVRMEAR